MKSGINYSFKNSPFYFFLFILSVGTLYPFVHNFFLFSSFSSIITVSFFGFWFSILFFTKKITFPNSIFIKIVVVQILFFILYSVLTHSINSLFQLFYLILSFIFIILCINSFDNFTFIKVFSYFNIFSSILCIIGVILFSFGLIHVLQIVPYQGDYSLYNFGFFFVKWGSELDFQVRPAGFYDEPGSFSFICMLLLLINKKYIGNKFVEYSLLLFPFITTSFAHFFTVLLYLILFKDLRSLLKISLFVFLISFVLVSSLNYFSDNEVFEFFQKRTVDRLDNILGGVDESRKGGLDLGPDIFASNPFGLKKETVNYLYPEFVNETIWAPLIYFGFFGFLFYYLPFIYVFVVSLIKKDLLLIKICIVLFFNLLQRPFYLYPLILYLIYILLFDNKILKLR